MVVFSLFYATSLLRLPTPPRPRGQKYGHHLTRHFSNYHRRTTPRPHPTPRPMRTVDAPCTTLALRLKQHPKHRTQRHIPPTHCHTKRRNTALFCTNDDCFGRRAPTQCLPPSPNSLAHSTLLPRSPNHRRLGSRHRFRILYRPDFERISRWPWRIFGQLKHPFQPWPRPRRPHITCPAAIPYPTIRRLRLPRRGRFAAIIPPIACFFGKTIWACRRAPPAPPFFEGGQGGGAPSGCSGLRFAWCFARC